MHRVEKYLSGSIAFNLFGMRFVIYGFNAMHIAMNIRTRKWGYICFHPSIRCFGELWPWYFYLSPNATPQSATFAIGPGVSKLEKAAASIRCYLYGHNFSDHDYYYDTMKIIIDKIEYIHWQDQEELDNASLVV